MEQVSHWDGRVYNVGGGQAVSTSLLELTGLAQEITGNTVGVESQPTTSPVDIRIYLTDHRRVSADFGWKPQRTTREIARDIYGWLREHEDALRHILA